MLIDHNQAVHARLANRIEDGVQTISQRACVDTRKVLEMIELVWSTREIEIFGCKGIPESAFSTLRQQLNSSHHKHPL